MAYSVFLRKSDAYSHALANTKTYEDAELNLKRILDIFKGKYPESDFYIQETPFYTGN